MAVPLPANLALCFERGSWREVRNPHYDEDMTESGKPIRSKKPSTPMTPVGGSVIITDAEMMGWEAFFKAACAEGTLPFEAPDPGRGARRGSLQTFWWLGPPEFSDVATRIRMTLQLARE